jgi:hypothetical protein
MAFGRCLFSFLLYLYDTHVGSNGQYAKPEFSKDFFTRLFRRLFVDRKQPDRLAMKRDRQDRDQPHADSEGMRDEG